MKKVIVTGINGLIGQYIAEPLKDLGFKVYGIGTKYIKTNKFNYIKIDINNISKLRKIFNQIEPQYLIHLAWDIEDLNSNNHFKLLSSSISMLDCFKECGGKKAVYIGTCFEYKYKRISLKENDKLNITLIADDIKNLYTMLENFELDMAVLEGKPANKSFNFTVIDTDMLTLVASKGNVLAKKSTVSLSELKKQNLILRLPNSATREKFASSLEAIGESLDEFNVVIEVDSVSTIKNLVRKNAGVTVMSKSACLKEVNKGSLVSLPIENLSMIRETAIVYDKSFSHPEIVDEIAKSYIDAKNGFYNA